MNDFLQKAYMETVYHVMNEPNIYKIKLDAIHPEFNAWCERSNIKSWAFITAYNPFSKELTKNENILLNSQLKETIIKNGYNFNYGSGVPNNENWDSEESFFIQNITLDKAKEIGVAFKQNAIVFGQINSLQELIWLDENINKVETNYMAYLE
jgi:hypothetical protein